MTENQLYRSETKSEDRDVSNVVPFASRNARRRPAPALTSNELVRLRAMLEEFDKIKKSCPMARRLLEDG